MAGHAAARWLSTPEASVLMVLFLLWLIMAMVPGRGFFASYNQDSLRRAVSLLAIYAVGELLVILTGGIDLSVGSLVGFSGMLLATIMTRLHAGGLDVGAATAAGVLVVLLFSLGIGVLHAVVIHFLRLPPFVVTLGSMSMLRSASMLLNNNVPVPIADFGLILFLGNKQLYLAGTGVGLPVPTVVLIMVAGVLALIMALTRIGRQVYAVGSNEEAARLSGVGVFGVRAFVYGTCSLLAGLAGILYTGYGAQGSPGTGVAFELSAISAAVIGGAVLTGGRGTVVGTLLGATLLESLVNSINLYVGNATTLQGLLVGGVLLAAVIFNRLRQRDPSGRH